NGGGKVIAATTLTASKNSEKLLPLEEQYAKIKDIEGINLILKEFGHDYETLTRAEAGQLIAAKTIDEIRNRILKSDEKRSIDSGSENNQTKRAELSQIKLFYPYSRPIHATPAEHYLHKIIENISEDFKNIRFHPAVKLPEEDNAKPAILFPLLNKEEKITAE